MDDELLTWTDAQDRLEHERAFGVTEPDSELDDAATDRESNGKET
jgi:hypothetical protein